jgi:hypothetical protein
MQECVEQQEKSTQIEKQAWQLRLKYNSSQTGFK